MGWAACAPEWTATKPPNTASTRMTASPTPIGSKGHQPFHWFVEFYGIMSKGGFDVVVGNPPYVEYSKVKSGYTIQGFQQGVLWESIRLCVGEMQDSDKSACISEHDSAPQRP